MRDQGVTKPSACCYVFNRRYNRGTKTWATGVVFTIKTMSQSYSPADGYAGGASPMTGDSTFPFAMVFTTVMNVLGAFAAVRLLDPSTSVFSIPLTTNQAEKWLNTPPVKLIYIICRDAVFDKRPAIARTSLASS